MWHILSRFRQVSVSVFCICSALLSGCSASKPSVPPTTVPKVVVTAACASPLSKFAYASGNLESEQSVNLVSKVQAKLKTLPSSLSGKVKAGDVLFTFDDDGVSENNLMQAKSRANNARAQYQRAKKASSAITKQALDNLKAAYDQAVLAVKLAQIQVDQLTIKAPFDGELTNVSTNLRTDQQVAPGTMLATVSNDDHFILTYHLSEDWLSSAEVGQAVEIFHHGALLATGKTRTINHKIDPDTGTFSVVASFLGISGANPGEDVAIKQVFGGSQLFFNVPSLSLQPSNSGLSVYVVRDKKLVRTPVTLSDDNEDGDSVAISSGLKTGDLVVTSSVATLHDGQTVDIDTQQSSVRCSQ